MRSWPGFEAPVDGIRDHVIRYLPRDYALFARLNPGDQYPEAHRHALNMLAERIIDLRRQGRIVREGSAEYERLKAAIVPPYDAGKFPNKWRKMWRDQPARTLMAHLGKDSYSHIHYDSEQARTISVREAARLQSFPDGFIFCGTMNPAFRQIGNAVPPLMARALATTLMAALRGTETQDDYVSYRTAAAV
jgi:DNA (cytosine-5)-methyltransferase 1